MASSITIDGLSDLLTGLEKESILAKASGAAVVAKTAKRIEATAEQLAPKGGDPRGRGPNRPPLAPSIESTKIGDAAWEIGPTALQGRFMEYGDYKDAPQPFMGPATDAHEDEIADGLEKLVGNL
jgi:HK97 gp10 family phage protein